MFRVLLAVGAIAFAAPAATAAPVPPEGGKGIVFPYPANAPIVVCLNGYDKARDRLNKMLTAALPKDADMVKKLLDEQLDKVFEGRKLTAVRKDARAFLVLNDLGGLIDDSPAVSALIPVTKYQGFLDTFFTKDEVKTLERGREGVDSITMSFLGEEKTVYLVDLKEYAAIVLDKDTADAYSAKYTAATTDAMGSEVAETFIKADVALYVNMDAINVKFGDQIRGIKGLIDFGLEQAQQQGALGVFNQRQIDALKSVFKGLLQGVEDSRAIVAAAEFKPEGLLIRVQARFADDSPSIKFLASEQPAALAEIAKLPAGLGMYQGSRFGKTVGELMRELSVEFATTDEDARGADLIEGHLKDLTAAGPQGDFVASSTPDAAIAVAGYKDAPRAAKAITKAFKAVAAGGRINSVVVKVAPRVNDEAETYKGFTFSLVSLTHDFEASVAGYPEMVREATLETLKRAVTEKATHWIGTDGKVVVRLTAKDWTAAKGLLDKYLAAKETLGATPGFKRVRDQLPKEANFLVLAEVESALSGLVSSLKTVGDAIPGFPKLGPIKKGPGGDAAYLGIAVTLKGDTATVTAFVPVEAMATARGILDSILKKIE